MNDEKLIEIAKAYRENAYVPYSNFKVGAAVLAQSGKIYGGCNIENASFGLTNCAERTAIFKAVSEGERALCAIAIAAATCGPAAPCGACRQVMREFKIPRVLMINLRGDIKIVTLEELLPFSFSEDSMESCENIR